ncbi:unnamed protein product [Didymodactylos carnosus]|uniref:General transcription factor IIH subunit 3 n=1 Tax=Didymodactylos carnosus TaxID=1234261 RepID=A0A8S2GNF3_9BILA|nr:unnamed protein product [Didymodactylos carnosus]CAF3539197.1 unnamed protein product [Didymodactylos carnosus]
MPRIMPADLGLIQTQHDSFQRHEELIKLIHDTDVFYVPVRGEFGDGQVNDIKEITRRFDEDLLNKQMIVIRVSGKNIVDGICIQFIGCFDNRITTTMNHTGYEKEPNLMNLQQICGVGRVELDEQMYLKLSSTQNLPTTTNTVDSKYLHGEEKLIGMLENDVETMHSKDSSEEQSSHFKQNILDTISNKNKGRSMTSAITSPTKKSRPRTVSENVLTTGTSPTNILLDHPRLHSPNTTVHISYPSPSATSVCSPRVITSLKNQPHRAPSPVVFGHSPSTSSPLYINVLNSSQQSTLISPSSQTYTTISSSSPSSSFNDYSITSTSPPSNRHVGDSASISSSMSPSLSTSSLSPIESHRRVQSPLSSTRLHTQSIINHTTTAPIQITASSSSTTTNYIGSYTNPYIALPTQSPVGSHSLPTIYNFGVLPHAATNIAYITPATFDFAVAAAAANPGGMLLIATPNVQVTGLTPTPSYSEQQFQTHLLLQQQQQQLQQSQTKIQFAPLPSPYSSSFVPLYPYNNVQTPEQRSPVIPRTCNILNRVNDSSDLMSTTKLPLDGEQQKAEETIINTMSKARNKSFSPSSTTDKQHRSLSKSLSFDEPSCVTTSLPFKKRRVLNCVDEQENDEYEDAEVMSLRHLIVIIDLNPLYWSETLTANTSASTIDLKQFLNIIIQFVNAYIAFDIQNRLTLIGAANNDTIFLYPDQTNETLIIPTVTKTNMYEQLFVADRVIERNIEKFLEQLPLQGQQGSMITMAMVQALCYINRLIREQNVGEKNSHRILIIQTSNDSSKQYMNFMNAVFSSEKLNVPIDGCILNNDSSLLQQACDLTTGLYLRVPDSNGLLQYLIWLYLADKELRKMLTLPTKLAVDYRPACFCHQKLIETGFVCSVCLSIFCENSTFCSTCRSAFKSNVMMEQTTKKKKLITNTTTTSA